MRDQFDGLDTVDLGQRHRLRQRLVVVQKKLGAPTAMDPHLWPSLYPAIVVGLLVGLSAPGQRAAFNAAIGAFAGLIGGAATYFVLNSADLGAGATGSLGTIAASGVFAWLAVKLVAATQRS